MLDSFMRLSEALQKYVAYGTLKNKKSSMETYLIQVRQLVLYFRDCEIEDVKFEEIIDYMDLMLKIGFDRNSLLAKASAYKQFFVFFQSQGIVKFNADMIPVPEAEVKFPKIIEEEDYQKLLASINMTRISGTRDKALIMMLHDTGMRLNELRSLDIEDLDVDKMRALIKTEKSRGVKPVRMVFWTEATNEALKLWLEVRDKFLKSRNLTADALFINTYNRWKVMNRWSESSIENMMKILSYKANLGYTANPHRFRHSFGRHLAMDGANGNVISDMMGHANINSTRIYTVMNEKMMQETYDKHFKRP